jgi:molecular chaperone HtpG
MSSKQRFNLHLPGLLKVLAEHLYSTKKVAVRELIQNAHDSCVRRKIEGSDAGYRPRIDIHTDPACRELLIRDNGCGLTEEEIVTYLSTIGRGYTRELRERLSIFSAAEAAELIGQFGLGFLSAFLMGDEVTVLTRSFQETPTLRWWSNGDEHFELTPATEVSEIGTTVRLHIKPAASFILNERHLVETVRMYADFLPIPIYVNDESLPVNLMEPPWESERPEQALRDYAMRACSGIEPILVLPLRDWKVKLEHDTLTVPLQGFLFVPPGSAVSVREFGDLTVYIRRMFICDRERDLLPPWARFVRGVIDCPVLQPTASREGIHQDENFASVRQAIEEQLGRGLRQLAEHRPEVWKQLVRGHSSVIVSWAVKDNEFFERVQDLVPFRTSRGLLTLPEYLELSGGTLYYISRELGSLQEQVLAEGRDVPAIDAAWFEVAPFLEKYAARHPQVGLVQLDGEAQEFMRPTPEAPFAALLNHYRSQGLHARMAVFKPAEMPAVILYPQGADIAREAGDALAKGELPSGLAGLIGDYVQHRFSADDLKGTLYLNAACPLIRHLAEQPPAETTCHALLTVLYQMARLFCGRMLNAPEAAEAFRHLTEAMLKMTG